MLSYLDPATGGMILQGLIAAAAGAAVAAKLYWHKAKRALGLSRREATEDEPAT